MWKPNTTQTVTAKLRSFLNSNKGSVTPTLAPSASKARLGPSLHIKGDITGTEDLLVEGSVEGMIQLDEQKLTVGPEAKLKAGISARDVEVYGQVKGNVHATGKIAIKKGGSVVGNLTMVEIFIEDGADFKGSLEMDRGAPNPADQKVLSSSKLKDPEWMKTHVEPQQTTTTVLERFN